MKKSPQKCNFQSSVLQVNMTTCGPEVCKQKKKFRTLVIRI